MSSVVSAYIFTIIFIDFLYPFLFFYFIHTKKRKKCKIYYNILQYSSGFADSVLLSYYHRTDRKYTFYKQEELIDEGMYECRQCNKEGLCFLDVYKRQHHFSAAYRPLQAAEPVPAGLEHFPKMIRAASVRSIIVRELDLGS